MRHLEVVQNIDLVEKIHYNRKWKFFIPEAVVVELHQKHIEEPLQRLLDHGIISVKKYSNPSVTTQKLNSLGSGEYEIICIVSQCHDKTYREYLILTDDCKAQGVARELGMSSHDVLVFMLLCNRNGQLSKKRCVTNMEEILKFMNVELA